MKKEYEEVIEKFNLKELDEFSLNFMENQNTGDDIKVITPIDRTFLANIKNQIATNMKKK